VALVIEICQTARHARTYTCQVTRKARSYALFNKVKQVARANISSHTFWEVKIPVSVGARGFGCTSLSLSFYTSIAIPLISLYHTRTLSPSPLSQSTVLKHISDFPNSLRPSFSVTFPTPVPPSKTPKLCILMTFVFPDLTPFPIQHDEELDQLLTDLFSGVVKLARSRVSSLHPHPPTSQPPSPPPSPMSGGRHIETPHTLWRTINKPTSVPPPMSVSNFSNEMHGLAPATTPMWAHDHTQLGQWLNDSLDLLRGVDDSTLYDASVHLSVELQMKLAVLAKLQQPVSLDLPIDYSL
jgi:hypothetical protein